ncbi:MAG: hypothetical protein G3M78_03930 [Candidatus Nitrohelix vancouverensis]|uniref:HK97 gp10 family phage protein n=1 Tax=Candidatus Nitrohelix vancouverensis TaxID=2705534 RepID=A0A7T0C117_9BACT|nr:MAG: hypothetical protein G3M78_03930 [Candidatus Nitrohelix vancouverensis]
MLKMEFSNLSALSALVDKLANEANQLANETAREIVKTSHSLARQRVADPSRKPGKGQGPYYRSIQSKIEFNGGAVTGRLFSDAPYAGVIEFGSRPHTIRARNGKVLFLGGGRFANEVQHPGTPAFRVLEQSAEKATAQAQTILDRLFPKYFNRRS